MPSMVRIDQQSSRKGPVLEDHADGFRIELLWLVGPQMARAIRGTEGPEFKSRQPDKQCSGQAWSLGRSIGGGGQWFSEPAFGGPAKRPRLLGEPGFWVETTTKEVDPQSGGVDCRDPGFG